MPDQPAPPVPEVKREHREAAYRFLWPSKMHSDAWLDRGDASGIRHFESFQLLLALTQLLASRETAYATAFMALISDQYESEVKAAEARGRLQAEAKLDRIRSGLARAVAEYDRMERQCPGAHYGLRGEALRRFGELYLGPVVAVEAQHKESATPAVEGPALERLCPVCGGDGEEPICGWCAGSGKEPT